jgi:Carbohydrate esterase, sialic acid-specific acetylesterase
MNVLKYMRMVAVAMLAGTTVYGQEKQADSGKKAKPLKVYILAGQSNMTGMVSTNTFAHIKMRPETAKEFADLFDKQGNPVTLDDVYVSQWKDKDCGKLAPRYGGGKSGNMFGPEYTFGLYMHKKLQEPFLIIKTSEGGKDINFHYRPPSAVEWTPPAGHPDLIEKKAVEPPKLPIPAKLDLADDWTPEKPYALIKKHMGLKSFKGAVIGKVNGISPLYIMSAPREKIKGDPFQQGDLIIGVDGSGLRDDPVSHWREAFYTSKAIDGDWMIKITRWRKGKIETFDFDICDTIEGGRAKLPAYLAEQEKERIERKTQSGGYYRDMIAHVKKVLGDIKSIYPDYDAKAGYEIAGFVWFQGWNDMINEGVYPNRDEPRGYEQYTWLLEHLIKDLRKDLNAPNMKAVIGVMGIGGVQTEGNMGYFQQAQAAVADSPEFKGNVVAVQTGKYWDSELAALVEKSNKLKEKMNDFKYKDGLTGEALKKACEEYRAKQITPKEEELLKKGVSNAEFHYLGSAKIMCGIGKGFAEAMLGLQEKK